MNTYIALLRGINVGGHGSLPMKELLTLLEKMGARQARTYIQSGNAVFRMAGRHVDTLARDIAQQILASRGFEPSVQVLALEDVLQCIAANPFPEAVTEPATLHLGFLSSTPSQPDLARLNALKKDSERFVLTPRVFYLHAPEGVGRSKLAAGSEKALGVTMTDRNWKTVTMLAELAR